MQNNVIQFFAIVRQAKHQLKDSQSETITTRIFTVIDYYRSICGNRSSLHSLSYLIFTSAKEWLSLSKLHHLHDKTLLYLFHYPDSDINITSTRQVLLGVTDMDIHRFNCSNSIFIAISDHFNTCYSLANIQLKIEKSIEVINM